MSVQDRCYDCRQPMVAAHPARDEEVVHQARGACTSCYGVRRRAGTVRELPSSIRPRDEVIRDWAALRDRGFTVAMAAQHLGMSVGALDRALSRAAGDGDVRARRPMHQLRDKRGLFAPVSA